jgi:hypothetical protein
MGSNPIGPATNFLISNLVILPNKGQGSFEQDKTFHLRVNKDAYIETHWR